MDRFRPAALVVAVGAWAILGQPAAAAQVYHLSRVVVLGATRLPAATVVGMTGLKPPTQVTTVDVERARQRLLDSGLFASVGYSFKLAGYSLTVTFTVQEPPWDSPILFDNFVWFTDEELVRTVARVLPTFTGLAPSLPKSMQRIAKALDAMIQRAGIQGSVSYMLTSGGSSSSSAYLYRVDLPVAMPVCSIELGGVSPSMLDDARASVRVVIGQDYSRDFVGRILKANLLPFYGQRGFLKADCGAIRAKAADAENCKAGVFVSVPVREGRQYTWSGATWSSAGDVPHAELDARLGLELGAVVDTRRLEQGLQAVRERFTRQGYIAARATHAFQYGDDAGTASATITITRGPRVRLGSFEIQGLPAETTEPLKAEWAHPTGEYYDALYVNDYLKAVKAKYPSIFQMYPHVSVTTTPAADSMVTVTIAFSRD